MSHIVLSALIGLLFSKRPLLAPPIKGFNPPSAPPLCALIPSGLCLCPCTPPWGLTSPSLACTAAACKVPLSVPSSDVKDLAQSFCDSSLEKASDVFATAVAKGGSGAEDAVAALIYAQTSLECLKKGDLFNIIGPPQSSESHMPCLLTGPLPLAVRGTAFGMQNLWNQCQVEAKPWTDCEQQVCQTPDKPGWPKPLLSQCATCAWH